MNLRILLRIAGFLLLLLCLLASAGVIASYQRQSTLPVFSLEKYPSQNSSCPNIDVYVLSSGQDVYVRDVPEFSLEPLAGPSLFHKIGKTTEQEEIFAIPENDDYVIIQSIFGFQPEIYRNESAPSIWLADLNTLAVKEVVFSDFKEFKSKRLWSTKDPVLIQDILQALDQPWEAFPEPWKAQNYRVDLLSDQVKGLSFYMLVYINADGQIYFWSYENSRQVVPVGNLFSQWIHAGGRP